jgi:gluconolactonase
MKILWPLLCALSLPFGSSLARAPSDSPVLRLDSSVDALVAADASLQTLFQGDALFEGPTWVRDGGSGYLIFSDVPGNVINRLNPDGSVSAFLANIFTGKDTSEAYQSFGLGGQKKFRMLGANGITLDRQGRVVYCAYSDGQIVRLETDGRRTVLASRFAASRLNAPNDLVYRSDGSLYFTDSRAGTQRAEGEGVPHEGLYVLRAGEVQLLSKDIDHPNGVVFSPDEKYLYVSNSRLKNILRFDVQAGGIANEKVFVDMSRDKAGGAPDGLKVDRKGNVYSTGPGGVWIISSGGKHIGTILTPRQITNIVFGGKGSKTLYMTGFGSLYRIPLKVAGK